MFQVSKLKTSLVCLLIFFFWFGAAQGARLYLEPNSGQYQLDQTFIVKVKIDTEQECVNAIKVNLSYDKDVLEIIDFSRGKSIISFWLELPKIDEKEGEIYFSGGIPGGYCGKIPGDPGEGDILGKIIFKIQDLLIAKKEKNVTEIKFLENSEVLLNDGLGTKTKLTFQGAKFEILEKTTQAPNQWEQEILGDKTLPEPFKILILEDSKIFEGKYSIIFQTVDKQTGIDYYEIKEGEKEWKLVKSPYLLEDQELKSIIKVKAVDKSGNERIAEYVPKKPFPWGTIIIILVIGGLIWIIFRKIYVSQKRKAQ